MANGNGNGNGNHQNLSIINCVEDSVVANPNSPAWATTELT